MLQSLHIKNIALIDELTLEFAPGLNILSGETGAGKSIIVDSLNLILGERSDRELIKTGQDAAFVEAYFDAPPKATATADYGIDADDGFIIAREITAAGKSTVRINGRMQTVSTLRELAEQTVDLHGQHEHQSLLDAKKHIGFLDSFGAESIDPLRASVAEEYSRHRKLAAELAALTEKAAERERRLSVLTFQIDEIEAAHYKQGEYDTLSAERNKMLSSEKVAEALGDAYDEIYDAPETAMLPRLKAAGAKLSGIAELDPRYAALSEKVGDIYYQLEECAYDLRDLKGESYFDEGRLERIENRLAALNSLKRKYGADMDAVMAFLVECQAERELLQNSETAIAELSRECADSEAELIRRCEALSAERKNAAAKFEAQALQELAELGLSGSAFEVHIERGEYTRNGYDVVEFFISTNAGEPVRPMRKVASGGEVSRIMLAFKVILTAGVGTMVFDEIDTGISGQMAHIVARKLRKLSQSRQVICVTHLPQIAAMGDRHYLISKSESGGRTATHIALLLGDDRVAEVARLAGGGTGAAMEHARELIAHAHSEN